MGEGKGAYSGVLEGQMSTMSSMMAASSNAQRYSAPFGYSDTTMAAVDTAGRGGLSGVFMGGARGRLRIQRRLAAPGLMVLMGQPRLLSRSLLCRSYRMRTCNLCFRALLYCIHLVRTGVEIGCCFVGFLRAYVLKNDLSRDFHLTVRQ